MRVFVTGASGFIGAHLVKCLLQADCRIAFLAQPDDPLTRLREYNDQLTVIRGDLDHIDAILPELRDFGPETCFHLAWYAEPGKYLYSPKNIASLNNSISLLQSLIALGCQQIVMTGTCAEYDTDYGYLQEDTPARPTTIYAATKLSMSILGQQLAQDANVRFTWARMFYLYGDMEDERRMIPALTKSLLMGQPFDATQGEQVRDYLHVDDAARALWEVAHASMTGVVNICSGVPVTVRQVMETVSETAGQADLIRFGALPYGKWEPMFICGSNDKLRRHTDWAPRYDLKSGLAENTRWWRQQLQAP